jgi:hypothetical protein
VIFVCFCAFSFGHSYLGALPESQKWLCTEVIWEADGGHCAECQTETIVTEATRPVSESRTNLNLTSLARPRLRPARSKGIMIGFGAALTGQSGLATAGPKLVKGLGHRLGVLSIPRWSLIHTCIYYREQSRYLCLVPWSRI